MISSCPTEERLAGFVHGAYGTGDGAALRAHVEDCPRCRDWVREAQANDELLIELKPGAGPLGITDWDDTPFDVPRSPGFSPASPLVPGPFQPPTRLEAGEQIGPYVLIEHLADGGMGEVYLAEQRTPVRRKVALKLIKLGMATRDVLARFESERQALAMMNHPSIAAIHDAGVAQSERPYFVMEYVSGQRITQYCDEKRFTIRRRLELFMQVCEAVQHAHQKGIIHRDLKPSNVLVTEVNGKPVPKVIDFGVAKAIGPDLSERSQTALGRIVGTLEYMSPEQSDTEAIDIDTRSDIYSLGVMLYELMTGVRPFEVEKARKGGDAEVRRILRETDPKPPSSRIAIVAESEPGAQATGPSEPGPSRGGRLPIAEIAELRGIDAKRLARQLKGDLDWITLKCLEKDRARRYATANGLALDLQRHLNHEAVEAGPPSAMYRLQKFIRRNKGPVAAVAVVILALTAGAVTGTLLYLRAESLLQRAVEAEELQFREREKAEAARDESEAVTTFLTETLGAADPEMQGKDVTVRTVLDRATETIGEKFKGKPLIEARLRQTLGVTYHNLGIYEKAEAHAAEAASLYRRLKGERDPATLAAMNNLGNAIQALGDYATSAAQHKATLEVFRRVLGEEHQDTLGSMNNLGVALCSQGRYAAAEELHRKTLDIRHRVLGEEHPDTQSSMNNLANALGAQGRYAEAEELLCKTLEIQRRVLGEEHPVTLGSMTNLADAHYAQGRYAAAEELHRKTLDIRHRVLGEEHPDTLGSMHHLAVALASQGRYTEAEELTRKKLDTRRRVLGEGHPDTLHSLIILANLLYSQGRYPEAEELFRRTLELQRRILGEEHPDTLLSMHNLANTLHSQDRYTEAEELDRKTLNIRRRVLGEEHPHTLGSINNLAIAFRSQSRYPEAEELLRRTLEIQRRTLGEEHPDTLASIHNLANALYSQGRYAEAEALHRKTLDIRRRVVGEEHPDFAASLSGLAEVLEKTKRCAEAEPLCRQAESILAARFPANHHNRKLNANLLGGILSGLGRFSEAEPLLLDSFEASRADAGIPLHDRKTMLERLVRIYESWDAAEPGKGYAEKAAEWRSKLTEGQDPGPAQSDAAKHDAVQSDVGPPSLTGSGQEVP